MFGISASPQVASFGSLQTMPPPNGIGPVQEQMPRNQRITDAIQGTLLSLDSLEGFAMQLLGENAVPRPVQQQTPAIPLPILLDNLPEIFNEISKRVHQVRETLHARLC